MGKIFDALQKHKKENRSDSSKSERDVESTASSKNERKQSRYLQTKSKYLSDGAPSYLDNSNLSNIHSALSDSRLTPNDIQSQTHQDKKLTENQHDAAQASKNIRTSSLFKNSNTEQNSYKKPSISKDNAGKKNEGTDHSIFSSEKFQSKPSKPLKKADEKIVFIKSSKRNGDPEPAKKQNLQKPYQNKALPDDQDNQESVRLDLILEAYWQPQSFISEQFKRLRTNLFFSSVKNPPRSILITSAMSGDGKSFTAANLAISIAQNINEHVLLIDCDLRRPQIQNLFGLPETNGLSDYLAQDVDLSGLLKKTVLPKLTILPSGPTPSNPAELLSSQKMRDLLLEVKNRYKDRYIILDSPPPQLTVETKALAAEVDGIVFVIKSGGSHSQMVKDSVEYLGKNKILGVVLNNFDERSGLFSYGKKGRYYKYYKYEKQ